MRFHDRVFRLGIRQKVVLILITVLLSALTISAWLALKQEEQDAIQEIHLKGSETTQFMAKALAYSVVGYDYHTVQLLLKQMTDSNIVAYAKVLNSNGSIMGMAGTLDLAKTHNLLIFHKAIKIDNDVVGHLTTGISPTGTLERLALQKKHLVERESSIILMIAICEFCALSYFIIRPVRSISEALINLGDEHGGAVGQLPVISNDEFGDLALQFNLLAKRLNEANARLRDRAETADQKVHLANKMLIEQSEELRKLNEELKQQSITDALTGLYNRRYFESLVEAEVATSFRYNIPNSLLLIDVDHFKKINDTYGHHAGDLVLIEIARRLKGRMRVCDTLCRLGGEEFVILCKNTDQQDAMTIGEQLRLTILEETFAVCGGTTPVSISIGASTVPDNHGTGTARDFYHHADVALYRSKDKGRNQTSHFSDCATSSA